MHKEYIQSNKQEMNKAINLHDTMLTKVVWNYQDRSVSFELTNWEWGGEGQLSFEGVVYVEGSALGLWGMGVTDVIYIFGFAASPDCSVSDIFAQCIQMSALKPEECTLPDLSKYFCVTIETNMGDQLRFVVSKVIWETAD